MIISADRVYNWLPGTTVGVRGGIPSAAFTQFCDITVSIPGAPGVVAVGDGVTDDTSAFGTAWALCPPNQFVWVPNRVYLVTQIFTSNNVSQKCFRGGGPNGCTMKFVPPAQQSPIKCGSTDYPIPGRPVVTGSSVAPAIASGGTQGSTSVVVVDASPYTIGKFCRVDAVTANYWVWAMNAYRLSTGGGPAMSSMHLVTGISGSTITFTPPLPINVMSYSPVLAAYTSTPRFGLGIEDMTIDLTYGDAGCAVEFNSVTDSWLKNVRITGSAHRQVFWNHCLFCEIRHCETTGTRGGNANHEGIDFFGDCCWNLVEDNVTNNGGFPAIILGDSAGGCCGNAVTFNFCKDVNSGITATMGADISGSHGCHNMFNLYEGNVMGMFQVDGYFGGCSHSTVARNWMHGKHTGITQGIKCFHLNHFSIKFNAVGNVLGDSTWLGSGTPYKDAPYTSNYDNGASNGAKAQMAIGFPNIGNTSFDSSYNKAATTPPTLPDYRDQPETINASFGIDFNVAATLIRHGNYHHGYSSGPEWDGAIADHVIPDSYLYASKPAWFGNFPWPPIDPANPPMTADNSTFAATIPAGYRYVNGVDAPTTPQSPNRKSISARYPRQQKLVH